MKFDLKRMFESIDSSNMSEEGPGRPTTPAEIKAYQEKMAKMGKRWDPKTNRVYDLVGGASGSDMQTGFNPMDLRTFQPVTEKGMTWNKAISGVDRDEYGLDIKNTAELTDEELFEKGFKKDAKSGDVSPLKKRDLVKINGVSYTFDKEGDKVNKGKKKGMFGQ